MSGLLHRPLDGFLSRVRDWSVTSQQHARRNAMLASTACAARRAEREAVEDFLAARYPTAPEVSGVPSRAHG